MRYALRTAITGAVTAATVLVCGTAQATAPGPGVTARVLAQITVNGTDYTLREITIPAGQSTGRHYHDGPLYGIVKQGHPQPLRLDLRFRRHVPHRRHHSGAGRSRPRPHRPQPG